MAADARSLLGSTVSGSEATVMRGPVSSVARGRRSRDRPRARRAGASGPAGAAAPRPSTTMLTGSVAPLGKSRCSASRPCLAAVSSGSDVVPASPMRRPSTGEARASSTRRRGDQADRRPAHHGQHGAPPERSLFAGRRRDAPPEPRHAQAIDAIAEHHQQRRMEGQRDQDRHDADERRRPGRGCAASCRARAASRSSPA